MPAAAAGDQERFADPWQVHSGVLENWTGILCDLTIERAFLNAIVCIEQESLSFSGALHLEIDPAYLASASPSPEGQKLWLEELRR